MSVTTRPDDGREHGATAAGGFSPASRFLLTLAAATITITGLYLSRGVVGPFAIAALVVMVAHPLRRPLQVRGVPAPLATAVVIVVAYLILLVMGVLLLVAVGQFVTLLPQYADSFSALESQLVPWSASSVSTPPVPGRCSPRSAPVTSSGSPVQ